MLSNTPQLPDDPAILKRLIVEICEERDTIIEHIRHEQESSEQRLHAVIEQIKTEAAAAIERMQAEHTAQIKALLRRYYGPKSEKFDPRQLLLFGELMTTEPENKAPIEAEANEPLTTTTIKQKKRDPHGRQQLPAELERIEIEHDIAEHKKCCPACGELRCRMGAEMSEQLEYFPANLKVLKHIRHKYACTKCDRDGYNPSIEVARKPAQPIEKGLPGPGLLAYIITSKLGDHLPLYRLEKIFARSNVQIARSTMCAWIAATGQLVQPLYDLLCQRVRMSRVLHTDDTPVPIQSPGHSVDEARLLSDARPDKQSGKQCRKGRIWPNIGDRDNPYVVYYYTPDRKRDGPVNWLRDFKGFLQADAFSGYDGIYTAGTVTEVACWAHARRKFYDAQDSDSLRAAQMLSLVGELYKIEDAARTRCAELNIVYDGAAGDAVRLTLRTEQSVPVLARIKEWLDTEREVVLLRSPMAAAIGYALNQWAALNVYVTDGQLNIDNNVAERAVKRVAIGRKNWLFAGHDDAAQTAAVLWSLIASAERHAVDPQKYLTSLLAKLPTLCRDEMTGEQRLPTNAELEQFLPDVWKKDDAAEPDQTLPVVTN